MHEIIISMGSHATTDNLKHNNGEFTVAFATAETMVASDFVGIVSAKNDPEKMVKTGWQVEKAPNVNDPLFKEFPMTMECRIKQRIEESETGYYLVAEVIGKNLFNCHSPKSGEKIRMMIETGMSNSYEVIHHGKHYFVHHTPWFEQPGGELSGLIELDIEIPENHPTFNRDKE